jgi:retron-type reverse transcriptase
MKKNMNQENTNQTNTPLIWEEIVKVKWTEFKQTISLFDGIIKTNLFQYSPHVNALEGIYKSSKEHFQNQKDPFNPPLRHNNLYDLVMSKDLLRISYDKLKKNRGALTPGTADQTADSFSEQIIEKIHNQLKNKTFKWNPTKRIEVQKPGRAPGVTRPLGLPDFYDKLVQNNIMMILMAIYEPEFQLINSNFGFRPKKCPNNAIKKIRIECNGMDIAIEGDVVGAYDNVKHNKLLKILRLRIADEKFLELIHDALKAGFMKDCTFYDTFLGTPQGGIHSPILFNIYMNEFDKFIKYQIPTIIKKWNTKKPYSSETNTNYSSAGKRMKRLEIVLETLKLTKNPLEILKIRQLNTTENFTEIFNSLKDQIPNTDKQKESVEKNIFTLQNQELSQNEMDAYNKYEYERNIHRGEITLKDFTPEEQAKIKKVHAKIGTESRARKNIKILIKRYKL